MLSRTAWELISETLTQTVLRLPGYDRLKKAGLAVEKWARDSLEATKRRLFDPGYVMPQANNIREKTLPLEVTALYFRLEGDTAREELLHLVRERMPTCVEDIDCLLNTVQQTGYETREKCVELMVKWRNCLMLLDSCLIVDPKERIVYYTGSTKAYSRRKPNKKPECLHLDVDVTCKVVSYCQPIANRVSSIKHFLSGLHIEAVSNAMEVTLACHHFPPETKTRVQPH